MIARTQNKQRFGKALQTAILLATILAAGIVLPVAVFPAEARPDELLGGADNQVAALTLLLGLGQPVKIRIKSQPV